ncbi:MAG TPA: inorganic phosphate transporter [Kineosporiaceae bacterium]|nr:inorganic phosphate transporter [Kineosporiaceae bacterium]
MDGNTVLLVTVVATALAFDFTNGFHDTANAMAASIVTGALKPKVAVALSGILNFVGAFLSLSVAATIAKGIVDSSTITLTVVFAGLIGGITWNLLTWYLGLPSSSSHALIGGVVGAAFIAGGVEAVLVDGLIAKVLIPAVLAPLVAIAIAAAGTWLTFRITAGVSARVRDRGFKIGQIGSASLLSLAHGTNDAQKTMGIITLALIANGTQSESAATPFWVVLSCAVAMGLGTYLGGWRVIRTLGKGLVEIEPAQGFTANGSSTAVILASTHFGFPLSTTQVCTGAIIGSGVGKGAAEVRWPLVGRMAGAWLITLPAAALVGAVSFALADGIGGAAGVVAVALLASAFIASIYHRSRRSSVDATNVNEDWTDYGVGPSGPAPMPVLETVLEDVS